MYADGGFTVFRVARGNGDETTAMVSISFTSESMPQSGNELQRVLREALERTAPLDDFVQVVRDLTQYEIRHGMNSASFFTRFKAGELGDEIELIRWANKVDIYREIKTELEQMVDLVEAYALPVMA